MLKTYLSYHQAPLRVTLTLSRLQEAGRKVSVTKSFFAREEPDDQKR